MQTFNSILDDLDAEYDKIVPDLKKIRLLGPIFYPTFLKFTGIIDVYYNSDNSHCIGTPVLIGDSNFICNENPIGSAENMDTKTFYHPIFDTELDDFRSRYICNNAARQYITNIAYL
jgi:hypothetical protein